jgi:hypothetical protein
MKLDALLDDIKIGKLFGPVNAILYSIEFQKRGLPHVHISVWLDKKNIDITTDIIDRFISAEIPDPKEDPLGYTLVVEHMIHGPCKDKNPSCICMKKGKCSKFYQKNSMKKPLLIKNGFTLYRRRLVFMFEKVKIP